MLGRKTSEPSAAQPPPVSLSSEDDSSKRNTSTNNTITLHKRVLKLSNASSRREPPAAPSIFSDADVDGPGATAASAAAYYSRNQNIPHPYADIDIIAETNSAPHSTYAASPVPANRPSSSVAAVAPNTLGVAKENEDDFDPSLLHVLSEAESDVHSVLSAPGDLSAHRDPFASLGLTPISTFPRRDKAAQILGIPHRRSMEPIPSPSAPANVAKSSNRFTSFGSRSATGGYTNPHPTIPEGGSNNHFQTHSHRYDSNARTDSFISATGGRMRALSGATTNTQMAGRFGALFNADHNSPPTPLSSLYLVAGLPKSHHAWTLADPDSVLGLQHTDGAVNKWWRPEVLGSTVSPGVLPTSSSAKETTSGAMNGNSSSSGANGASSSTPIAAANATAGSKANGAGGGPNGNGATLASSSASIDTKKNKRRQRSGTNATIPTNVPNPRDPGAGIGLSKSQVAKMLSKALKLSFTREVEIIASTLQPPSTVHSFTFSLPTPVDRELGLPSTVPANTGVGGGAAGRSMGDVRSSVYSATTGRMIGPGGMGMNAVGMISSARPSSTYLGPTTTPLTPAAQEALQAESASSTTYYGVCLTVWSHADEERSRAIRKTMELGLRSMNADGSVRRGKAREKKDSLVPPNGSQAGQARSPAKTNRSLKMSNPDAPAWSGTDIETEADDLEFEGENETDTGGISESDWEGRSRNGIRGDVGGSTLFLPGDTIFWLPYALTLVSRVPIYDLMRDFLTFSWARFSKDVHSHTLQIAKILSAPVPKPGELIKLDASPPEKDKPTDRSGRAVAAAANSLEMICRMPGGLDFGRGLVDVNFQMWPLFCCLSLDNILTCCEIALSPTGRVLFLSKHPAMLGIAVSTIKYLVELRGWNGIALQAVHSRDAKIYLEDPGPWILGLATEARYIARTSPEVCVCDLDINYVNCLSPPPGHVSTKGRRDRYRRILLSAFDAYFHPDHSVPSEFKEAFPAGRFRPVVKIQSRRGASSSVSTELINPPDWWNWTRVVGAFNEVLQDRDKPLSLFKRITALRGPRRQAKLTPAELMIQMALRKRASAFVDARDDLETKIGRLSRRLNFLLTESDLWREKFVQFEAYAEKLSGEAIDLRAKINKEQRESRRLTSLVTLTAQEKAKLQAQLYETEGAHRAAVVELDRMKNNMEKMELERAQMVAEVEAQIERALQSMMVGDSEGEWDEDDLDEIPNDSMSMGRVRSPVLDSVSNGGYESRPVSPGSIVSSHRGTKKRYHQTTSRPGTSHSLSDAKSANGGRLRNFGTATTLAEIADRLEQVKQVHAKKSKASSLHGHGRKSRASSVHHGSERGHRLKPQKSEPKLSGEEAGDEESMSERERAEQEQALKIATKRFSTGAAEGGQDGTTGGDGMMSAVDAGIVEKSDRIAEKMKQIQERFESALAAEEAAAVDVESENDKVPTPEMEANASGSEDEVEKFQPAPLTSITSRPRPTRAARPSAPRPKSSGGDPHTGSMPPTPTTITHRGPSGRRGTLSSLHVDTEAWRQSVATAHEEEQWRESSITAAMPEYRPSPALKAKSTGQPSPVASPKTLVPHLKRVASGASVGALVSSPSIPTPPVSAHTNTTMHSDSMSSGAIHHSSYSRYRPESRGGITTDGDSDADFQSAYSTSPRMTPVQGNSDLERSNSAFGRRAGSRAGSRQGTTFSQKIRPPSIAATTWSTGAVGGLGLSGTEIETRSRASSVNTSNGIASGERKTSSTSGSDHTVAPDQSSPGFYETSRGPHPPVVSLNNRGVNSLKNRRDSGTPLIMGAFPMDSDS
ncbi:SubName: Full=Uncharacterized protein {ECO:0000313/EMBL:CCA70849.1} [Serendipita indica DSM 11827]|nr:SubName: Full=Uncharacterized protein {ECO:0000313/EMBL:CCA70849.1} [Serendipita indica DSM 11827]